MPPPLDFSGGEKLNMELTRISAKISAPAELKVGFLENARYPDGTPIAYIAAINEFGGSWPVPARDTTVYRKINTRTRDYLSGGKFVKAKESNFATTHRVAAYTHTQPPRPFFRTMIAQNKDKWPEQIAALMRNSDYDVSGTLERMGHEIEGQLQQSIKALTSPPLARSTVRKKGFDKPLIDTGLMWQSTGHEVTTENE
jgi:hypothetical protein